MNMKRVVLWGLVFCLIWAGCGVAGETGGCEIAVPEEFNVSASRAAFDGVWSKAVAEAKTPEQKKGISDFKDSFNELSEIGKQQALYLYSLPRMGFDKSVYSNKFEDRNPIWVICLKENLERYIGGNAMRLIARHDGSSIIYGTARNLYQFMNDANTGEGRFFVEKIDQCLHDLWGKSLATARKADDVKSYNVLIESRWFFTFQEDVYQGLKDFGRRVNDRDKDGRTPLMRACSHYDKNDIVQALLDAGAKVDARDNTGMTALMIAAYNGHASVVELLLKSGANPNLETTGENRFTALTYAIQQKHPKAVAALIKGGANIEQKDERGRTAINEAGYHDNVDVVATLIKAGAKVDARDNEGSTALMNAAYEGHASVVELLLKSGANPNLETTEHKYTTLTFAAEQGQIQIFPILERYGIGREKILEAKISALKISKESIELSKQNIELSKQNIESLKTLEFLNTFIPKDKAKEDNQEKGGLKKEEEELKKEEEELKKEEEELKKIQTLYCSEPELLYPFTGV